MTAIGDLLNDRNRRRLLEGLAELEQLDALVRERSQQQSPPEPPSLAEISATAAKRAD